MVAACVFRQERDVGDGRMTSLQDVGAVDNDAVEFQDMAITCYIMLADNVVL